MDRGYQWNHPLRNSEGESRILQEYQLPSPSALFDEGETWRIVFKSKSLGKTLPEERWVFLPAKPTKKRIRRAFFRPN